MGHKTAFVSVVCSVLVFCFVSSVSGECPDSCPSWYVGDDYCDIVCWNEECDWDGGDCTHDDMCDFRCLEAMVGNGVCDYFCMISSLCNWDNSDCVCDISECPTSWPGDGFCDHNCDVPECQYDDNDCCYACPTDWIGDGLCDESCFVPECSYDSFDCQCDSSSCPIHWLDDGMCDSACNNVGCMWDMGDCGYHGSDNTAALGIGLGVTCALLAVFAICLALFIMTKYRRPTAEMLPASETIN
ncbi:hypothetical protein Pelo_13126 [Pelomyxa schiedti]|nr:hypothetical protein Pelo_13126 [Pelomyxa schiedti]